MDGMKQRPEPPLGHFRMPHLGEDGAETFVHNLGPHLASPRGEGICFSVVATRSDEYFFLSPFGGVGGGLYVALAVTDDDDGEHIHILGVELAECG